MINGLFTFYRVAARAQQVKCSLGLNKVLINRCEIGKRGDKKQSWNCFAISLEPGFQCQYMTCNKGSSECFMNSRKRAVVSSRVENLVHGFIFLSEDLIAARY